MTRTALVTGGNRGIGPEACRQLAGSGLDVCRPLATANEANKPLESCRTKG